MKRAVAALATLALGITMALPAYAAAPQFGSAQIKYTVAATAALSIAVNYSANGSIQPGVASTIFAAGTGSCSAGVAEGATATLTFGSITPPATAGVAQACYYKNAVSVGVSTNDSNGYTVQEGVDSVPVGTLICMFQSNTTAGASPTASGATAANVSTASTTTCPTAAVAGISLTAVTGQTAPTTFGAAGAPGGAVTTNTTAGPFGAFTGGGVLAYTKAAGAPAAGYNYYGQDIEMNIDSAASSGANLTRTIFYQLIPG